MWLAAINGDGQVHPGSLGTGLLDPLKVGTSRVQVERRGNRRAVGHLRIIENLDHRRKITSRPLPQRNTHSSDPNLRPVHAHVLPRGCLIRF
jgi:hypothetical protein